MIVKWGSVPFVMYFLAANIKENYSRFKILKISISGRAVDFKHWESGQPDDNHYQQQQDCVLLYPPHPDSNDSPGWHDQLCQDSDIPIHIPFLYEDNGWICEYCKYN